MLWLNDYPYVHDPSRDVPDTYRDEKWPKRGFMVGLLIAILGFVYLGETGVVSGLGVGLILFGILRNRWIEDRIAYWRFNEPDQINILDKHLTPGSIGITGDYIRTVGTQEHLRQVLNPEDNRIKMLLILMAIITILSVIALIAQIATRH